jgi:hypothetical protein
METNQTMKLIMMTYPGFQELPKGVKKMLLVSETFFFDEPHTDAHPNGLSSPAATRSAFHAHAVPTPMSIARTGNSGPRRSASASPVHRTV